MQLLPDVKSTSLTWSVPPAPCCPGDIDLLIRGPFLKGAVWEPRAVSDEQAALLPELIDSFEAALQPAPREAIVTFLARLATHFWNEKTQTEWQILFEDYATDLAEMPLDILVEGIGRYRCKGKWWPKVAELFAEMEPLLRDKRQKLERLQMLLAKAERDAIVRALPRRNGSDIRSRNAEYWGMRLLSFRRPELTDLARRIYKALAVGDTATCDKLVHQASHIIISMREPTVYPQHRAVAEE